MMKIWLKVQEESIRSVWTLSAKGDISMGITIGLMTFGTLLGKDPVRILFINDDLPTPSTQI